MHTQQSSNRKATRRRGTSVAAAALSMALVVPFAQPIAAPASVTSAQAQEAVTGTKGTEKTNRALPSGLQPKCKSATDQIGYEQSSAASAAIEADAIANGYIRNSVGMTNAGNTLSGKASLGGTGTVTNGSGEGLPDGVKVYMQWQAANGAMSPIYVTETHTLPGIGGQSGKGQYAFDLREGFYDNQGNYHLWGAWNTQRYRVWIEPQVNPESGNLMYPVRAGDGIVQRLASPEPGGRSTGQFQLIGQNLQRVDRRMSEMPIDATTGKNYMLAKNVVEMQHVGKAKTNTNSYSVSGRVWRESGVGGDISNSVTGPSFGSGSDEPAEGYKVYMTTLTPAGVKALEAISGSERADRTKVTRELILANPGYLEKTYVATTDQNGEYSINGIETPGRSFLDTTRNVYMWVEDPKGVIVQAHSGYVLPLFANAAGAENWRPVLTPNRIVGAVHNSNFAITSEPQSNNVNMFVRNFNTLDYLAKRGDTAQLALDGTISLLPTKIEWVDNAGNVLQTTEIRACDDVSKADFTVPQDAKDGATYTARLYVGDEVRAADSFMVSAGIAADFDPEYTTTSPEDVTGELSSDAPKFFVEKRDGTRGEETEKPVGTKFSLGTLVDPGSPSGIRKEAEDRFERERGFKFSEIKIDPDTGVVTLPKAPLGETPLKVPVIVTYPGTEQTRDFAFATFETVGTSTTPSLIPGATKDEIIRGAQEPTLLDDRVKNPKDGLTGHVLDKDSKVIDSATVTIDPMTGEVSVKVPEGATIGTATVVITDGNTEIGQIPVTIKDPGTVVDRSGLHQVNPTDESQDTGIRVVNPDADTTIKAKDKDGESVKVEVVDGKVMVTPGTDVAAPITVTITDPDLPDGSTELVVPVAERPHSDEPAFTGGTVTDEITQGDPKKLDDKVAKPTEGMSGEVRDKDGKKIEGAEVSVDPITGEITVSVPENAPVGDATVVIKDKDGKDVGQIEVKITAPKTDTEPNQPASTTTVDTTNVNQIEPTNTAQDTGIKVNNPGGTVVVAKDEDGKTVPVVIDDDGKVVVTPGEDVDGPITVTIIDGDLPNGPVTVEVPISGHTEGQDDNDKPSGNDAGVPTTVEGKNNPKAVQPTDDAQDTGITVKNPDGTTVVAKDEDGKTVPVVIDEKGNVRVTPGTDVDGPITVTIIDSDLPNGEVTVEVPVAGHTKGTDDNSKPSGNDAGVPTTVEGKNNPKAVQPTDEAQNTGITVKNPDGTTVVAKDEDGKSIPVVIDKDGNVRVTPGTDVDGPITVTIVDSDLPNGQVTVEVPVAGHTKGKDDNSNGNPIAITPGSSSNEIKPGETKVIGDKVSNPAEGMTGVVKNKDGNPIKDATVTVDPNNGEITVKVPEGTKPGDATVVITDKDGNTGEVKVTITEPSAEAKPSVTPGSAGDQIPAGDETKLDDKVSNPTTGMTGVVKDKDGDPIKDATVTVDPNDGEIKVTVPKDTKPGDATVQIKDKDGNDVGTPIKVTVTEPSQPAGKTTVDDTKVTPIQPTNDGQNTGIKVNNPGGTTVVAQDEDGKTIPAVIGTDGHVYVTPGTDVDGPITVTIVDGDLPGGKATVKVPVAGHSEGKNDNSKSSLGDGNTKTTVGFTKVNPVQPTDAKQDTGITVNNPAGATVVAVDEDGNTIPAVIGTDGHVYVTPGTDVDGPITVTVIDADLPGGSVTTTVPVSGHAQDKDDNNRDASNQDGRKTSVDTQGSKPVAADGTEQKPGITVTNPGGTSVVAKDKDGKDVPARIDENGDVHVTPGTDVKGPITVTIIDSDLPGGKTAVEVKVTDSKDGATTVDGSHVKAVEPTGTKQDTGITVTNVHDGTTVSAKDGNGNDVRVEIRDGKVFATPGTDATGPITVTITDPTLDGHKTAVEVTVKSSSKSKETVGVNSDNVATIDPQGGEQDTNITVDDASNQTKVSAEDEDGQSVKAGIDNSGNIVLDPTKDADGNPITVDGPITVTITDPSLPDGKVTVTVPVKDHAKGVDDNANGTPRPGSPSGSSGDIDAGRCAATAMGFGLPLLALVPLGLATQIDIPVVTPAVQQFNQQLQQVNTMIQQQMGIFNPQLAGQVDSLNAQLARVAPVAGGLALIAVGLLAGTLIYDACAPGGLGSSNR